MSSGIKLTVCSYHDKIMRVAMLAFISALSIATAQVDNNNIRNRSVLELNASPSLSSTAHNTVEWECLDKKLTDKCLVYHNDQWFSFTVDQAGDYFINISSQECRDSNGVQLIIIEGNPCETKTYRILECIPRIQQDNVFVELKKLKPGTKYLINIDGFLGDFCKFNIQFSTTPYGLPRVPVLTDSLEITVKQRNKVVELSWELNDEGGNSVNGFNIYRKRAGSTKSELIREMSTSLNALGTKATTYSVSDTLPQYGTYTFAIYGLQSDSKMPILLAEHVATWSDANFHSRPAAPPITTATFPVTGKAGSDIELVLFNRDTDERLWTRKFKFEPSTHATMQVDLASWLKTTKRFLVLVVDTDKSQPVEYYFTTDRNGNVRRE